MVATVARPSRQSQRRRQDSLSLRLIESSLSGSRIERQSPWLAGLHRVSSGALAGLGLSVIALSALTLHWQNEWARSYSELEASKALEHRLQESAALLEQHHLGAMRKPGELVPTSSTKLIHLKEPEALAHTSPAPLFAVIQQQQIPAGY
ncbi:MAG: hypothetical protein WAM11_01790 [Cyanobium sp.]